jgi:hypothetical protein
MFNIHISYMIVTNNIYFQNEAVLINTRAVISTVGNVVARSEASIVLHQSECSRAGNVSRYACHLFEDAVNWDHKSSSSTIRYCTTNSFSVEGGSICGEIGLMTTSETCGHRRKFDLSRSRIT